MPVSLLNRQAVEVYIFEIFEKLIACPAIGSVVKAQRYRNLMFLIIKRKMCGFAVIVQRCIVNPSAYFQFAYDNHPLLHDMGNKLSNMCLARIGLGGLYDERGGMALSCTMNTTRINITFTRVVYYSSSTTNPN